MTAVSPTVRQPRRLPWQSAAIAVVLVAFLAAWGSGWIVVRDRVAAHSDYCLRAEQIELTPLPPWIRADVKGEALRGAGLDRPLSLLEDDLARRMCEAFRLHPWIARVERVGKRYPTRMTVEVVYRRPACVVEVQDRHTRDGVSVDIESVVLPAGDFSRLDGGRLPLLRGIDTPPSQPGTPWGDERVLDGCRLAAALSEVWLELQLASLAPLPRPEEALDEPHRYELLTRSGTRVLWGLPATGSPADKAILEAKIARLRQSLAERATDAAARRTIYLESLDAAPAPDDGLRD